MTRRESAEDDARRPLVWADAAKGVCIVLVVLHHLVSKHYVPMLPGSAQGMGAAWESMTYALKPVRLPLFFLISGFFAARALRRPWSEVWPTRCANLYLVYAGWLCIHAVLFTYLRQLPMNRTRSGTELALDLVYASTGLWYLYALVVYFAVARLLSPWGPRTVVVLAASLAVVTPWLGIAAANRASVLQHFVYFVVGAFFPAIVERMTRLRAASVAVLAGASVVASTVASALPVAVRAAVAVAQWSALSGPLTYLGRRTLPIYVLHVPVLAGAHQMLAPRLLAADTGVERAALVAYPLVGTAAVIVGCLLVHRALQEVGAGWLFRGPFPSRAGASSHGRAARPEPEPDGRRGSRQDAGPQLSGIARYVPEHDVRRDVEVPRQPVEREVPRLEHIGEPVHLAGHVHPPVDGTGTPEQEVLVVMDAPGGPGLAVPLLLVGELPPVPAADLPRERDERDRDVIAQHPGRRWRVTRGRGEAPVRSPAHSATTS